MITIEQRFRFAEYRENLNDDIILWNWLYTNGYLVDARKLIQLMVDILVRRKQTALLGRYYHNLAVTEFQLGLKNNALRSFKLAWKYDAKRYGAKKAKRMMAYKAMREMQGVVKGKKK